MFDLYFQAKRVDVKCIILPEENKKDFNDLPKYITDGLEVHFASTFDDVYRICFLEGQKAPTINNDETFSNIHISSKQPGPLIGKQDLL